MKAQRVESLSTGDQLQDVCDGAWCSIVSVSLLRSGMVRLDVEDEQGRPRRLTYQAGALRVARKV